jgi:hypothetical protein
MNEETKSWWEFAMVERLKRSQSDWVAFLQISQDYSGRTRNAYDNRHKNEYIGSKVNWESRILREMMDRSRYPTGAQNPSIARHCEPGIFLENSAYNGNKSERVKG